MSEHPFHTGELDAQLRFNDDWNEQKALRLARIVGDSLGEEEARFIEGLPFFFLATSDVEGNCDCSFKGTEPDADGRLLSIAWVAGPRRLVFPDYAGNRMFNSLGNILGNPHVGMLFIHFATRRRLRVNGRARILDLDEECRTRWPPANRIVEVEVEQVYWNCSKRIPTRP